MQLGLKLFFPRQNNEQAKENTFNHRISSIPGLGIVRVIVRFTIKQ